MIYRPTRKLKPPKGFRRAMPRVCGSCRFHTFLEADGAEGGAWRCLRDPNRELFYKKNVDTDAGDMMQWFYTCDRWTAQR